jgi:hypothetical protein
MVSRVIVIDNASTAGNAKNVKMDIPRIELLENDTITRYGEAANQSITIVRIDNILFLKIDHLLTCGNRF